MNKTYLIAIAAALMVAPLALAHDPAGTYKTYCEPAGEWDTHEYAPPATGVLLQGYEDGNLDDCDGGGNDVIVVVNGPCPPGYEEFLHIPGPPVDVRICIKRTADFDGHAEYARGGAWILVETGAGVPSSDPNVGAGTEYCYGDEGHHTAFGSVQVIDVSTLANTAEFTVASDTIDLTGVGEGCGDFESDNGSTFVGGSASCSGGSCTVTFGAGLDGSYQVYVQGTQGHVIWTRT
jgi:hypothetical protein